MQWIGRISDSPAPRQVQGRSSDQTHQDNGRAGRRQDASAKNHSLAGFLKLKEENTDVNVVIASGYLEPELKSEMSRAGIEHFVAKPYMMDEVLRVLQNAIGDNEK